MSATTDYIIREQRFGDTRKVCSWCKGVGYQPDLYHGKIQCRKCLGKGVTK